MPLLPLYLVHFKCLNTAEAPVFETVGNHGCDHASYRVPAGPEFFRNRLPRQQFASFREEQLEMDSKVAFPVAPQHLLHLDATVPALDPPHGIIEE